MSILELSAAVSIQLWRPSTHHTWSELKSVDVFIMLLVLGGRDILTLQMHFCTHRYDYKTWTDVFFPNRTINGPINHARVHNTTDRWKSQNSFQQIYNSYSFMLLISYGCALIFVSTNFP